MGACSVSCEEDCHSVGTSARLPLETGTLPWGPSKLRGGQYMVRVGSPSRWKGRGTQEGAGEREQVTLREGTVLFRGEKGN